MTYAFFDFFIIILGLPIKLSYLCITKTKGIGLKRKQEQFKFQQKTNGGYCVGVHLFPFRTEKLSPTALMVLG